MPFTCVSASTRNNRSSPAGNKNLRIANDAAIVCACPFLSHQCGSNPFIVFPILPLYQVGFWAPKTTGVGAFSSDNQLSGNPSLLPGAMLFFSSPTRHSPLATRHSPLATSTFSLFCSSTVPLSVLTLGPLSSSTKEKPKLSMRPWPHSSNFAPPAQVSSP